jgi:S-adenosylhomocysteine hydrolase
MNKTKSLDHPIFSEILSKTNFGDYWFIFVHHLTVSNEPFLREWVNRVKSIGVISIPYSEVSQVKKRLSKITRIFSPKTLTEIPNIILDLAQKNGKRKIVLVEVGGYSSHVSKYLKNVVLSIEDTNQGHWLQQENKYLKYPIVSIANTDAKKLENRYVGESIVRTIEKLLKRRNIRLISRKISVISYGGIGESVCLALRDRGNRPYVYDIDPSKVAHAFADGYKIADRDYILAHSDIIIGCTGKQCVAKKDISLLKPGTYLFSGSSKQIEFQDFVDSLKYKKPADIFQKLYFGKTFIWLGYYGQPINFLDKTEPKMFDVPFALQLTCFNFWLSSKLKNKVYSLPRKYQKDIFVNYIKYNSRYPKSDG